MPALTMVKSSATALTFDISSLASDDNLLDGYASAQISVGNVADILFNVLPITIHASTAPAVGDVIELYMIGQRVSFATTNYDVITGTAGDFTLSHEAAKRSMRRVAIMSATAATANKTFQVQPFAAARFFGGTVPDYLCLFLVHNMGAALAASQSSLFSYQTVTPTTT